MKLNQLSVFLENRPGRLSAPCKALAEAGVNIATLSLADTERYGILRLIVRDWQKARQALEKACCVVNVAEVLDIVEQSRHNLEYMYAFTVRAGDRALLVFRFEDPDAAIELLKSKGVKVLETLDFL